MVARLLTVFVALLVLIGGLAWLKYSQIRQEIAMFSQPMPAPMVAVTEVRESRWEPTLETVGTVKAVQGVEVSNQVAGQVEEILFESGASVKAGDVLVRLDVDVDEADLVGLKAAQRLAQLKLARNRSLLKDKAVSQGDFDESNAQLDQASALVQAKEATIAKKVIRAPFAGQLGIRAVNLGEYLKEGTPVVPLQALDPVYVDYSLPEREISQLRPGQGVRVRVSAYPDRTFEGAILAVSPRIDAGTRNVAVRAELKNSDLLLRPGMFARVSTLLPAQERVLTLPREAVFFNTYGDSVFALEEKDGKILVQRRQIRTGSVRGDEVAVLDGLKLGDRVVSAGQVKLANGQEIRIAAAESGAKPPVAAQDAPE